MKKPANFASVLVIAAALAMWGARSAVPADKLGTPLAQSGVVAR